MDLSQHDIDKAMMARCVELSRVAVSQGENPFASVIALDGKIVAEATNRIVRDADLSRHAEIVAIFEAGKVIGGNQLRRSTLYTNVEPCAMCAYCIREAGIGRVAYALGSPVMGGLSKWNILCDDGISDRIPQVFGAAPEVVKGLLAHEAQAVWRDWSPLAWQMIKFRGLLIEPSPDDEGVQVRPAQPRSVWHYLQMPFARSPRLPIEAKAPDISR